MPDSDAPKRRGRPRKVDAPVDSQPQMMVPLSLEALRELLGRAEVARAENPQSDLALALQTLVKQTQEVNEGIKRTHRVSNTETPQISAFSYPEGERARPKGRLRYETYFCGGRQDHEQLTPLEIELYNAIERNTECRNGRWTATFREDGTKKRLFVTVPASSMTDMDQLPSLVQILSELATGTVISDPNDAITQIMALKKQVEELTARVHGKELAHA